MSISQPRIAPCNLLLVEDSMSMARVYMEYLRKGSYYLRHALTGRDAMAAVHQDPPDLVLLDLRLPDMEGLDVLHQVKAANPRCAIIVITADGSINRAIEAMREGAMDFLVKPVSSDRLLTTLSNALQRVALAHSVDVLRNDGVPQAGAGRRGSTEGAIIPLHLVERRAIEAAIAACAGNITAAADCLEIHPSTLYRKIAAWNSTPRNGDTPDAS